MTAHDPDVRAVRDVLIPAVERDARRRRLPRRVTVTLAVFATAAAGTGVAAATGVIFAEPNVNPAVPAAQEWLYYSHDPTSPVREGGPVLMRFKPEAVERTNRATERALLERGVVARCGEDSAHPLACYLADGEQVEANVHAEALAALEGPDILEWPGNAEIKPLSEAEARRWLCDHPDQAPADAPRC